MDNLHHFRITSQIQTGTSGLPLTRKVTPHVHLYSPVTIPAPFDAVIVDDWRGIRTFTGSSWRVPVTGDIDGYNLVARDAAEVPVEIRGVQFADGRVDRWVAVGDIPEDLPLATARMLAASLADAVAEAERQ